MVPILVSSAAALFEFLQMGDAGLSTSCCSLTVLFHATAVPIADCLWAVVVPSFENYFVKRDVQASWFLRTPGRDLSPSCLWAIGAYGQTPVDKAGGLSVGG
jgi:hypothetical protein